MRNLRLRRILFALSLLISFTAACSARNTDGDSTAISFKEDKLNMEVEHFLDLIKKDDSEIHLTSINFITKNWKEEYEIMLLEMIYLIRDPTLSARLTSLLEQKTGKSFGYDFNKWYRWIWNKEEKITPTYHEFKAELHKLIDPKFEKYFKDRQSTSTIRFDEVRWGGVLQDGIPPLRDPEMIAVNEAEYLQDDNIVFGIEVNGDVRAYPKRILAWHEMFVDEVGGIPVAGVYCTLCGTVILYKTQHNGVNHQMGTSGFLYRSNKLMYDQATQSLWNTLWGEPVIGPLVGKGIKLDYLSVVTTTWGEWKKRHPETQVLSLNTGHRRDYGEGVAYKDYFATDRVMFNVPSLDKRLKNKDEVLAIRVPELPHENVAISSKLLKKNPVFEEKIGEIKFVVFTDKTGGNRVYKTGELSFVSFDGNNMVTDNAGQQWTMYEDRLESKEGLVLHRIPTHRAFWFGYQAAFPNTRLVK